MKKLLAVCLLFVLPVAVWAQNYSLRLQSGAFTPKASSVKTASWSQAELVDGNYYRFIQFFSLPTEKEKADLAAAGLVLLDYIPENAWMVAVPSTLNWGSIDSRNIRVLFPIAPKHKLSAELAKQQYPSWAKKSDGRIELIVSHPSNILSSRVSDLLTKDGFEVVKIVSYANAIRVILKTGEVNKLAALPYIISVELMDANPRPDNLVGKTDHRSNVLSTDYAAGLHYDGTGVTVALNDDGVIGPHIDQTGRIAAQYITFNNGDHGDHCSGTIFGAGNLNPTTRGMAFGATLRVYGVSSAFSTDYQAFDSIYNHYNQYGVRITSTSYSDGNNAGYTSLARLMDQQINNLPQLMHVFSSGNNGTAGTPSTWYNITGGHKAGKNVITVGNVTYDDQLNSSSSRGPAKDGRIKPDICAVGTSVNSTIANNLYDVYTGTSMACPGVSGTLAQLYQAYKSLNGGNNPPSALIKAVVMNTADDLGNPGPDFRFGYGRINARRALGLLQTNQYRLDSVTTGVTKNHVIAVPAGTSEVRIMVYWQDKEAAANAATALVNNLNMTVTTPAATTVQPWILNHTANATALNTNATQGVDNLNNVEQVTIPTPAAGNYTVNVTGFAVPQGPQKYYMVYEFVTSAPVLTYPIGGESLVPGTQETIRWDAYGNSGTFTLQYSTNNGSTWTNISTSVPATQRYYNWTPPATVTGEALIKVTRGTASDVSDAPFSIIGMPGSLTVNWACPDSMRVSYTAVTGATGYVVSILGASYMDSTAFSTTTSCTVPLNTAAAGWYSVHAVGANNCKGRRALAKTYQAMPFNCPTDLAVVGATSPALQSILDCTGNSITENVTAQIQNNVAFPVSNVSVSYSINGAPAVTENYPGSIPASALVSYTFTQPHTYTTSGLQNIQAWTTQSGDQEPANDMYSWQKSIHQSAPVSLPLLQDFESFNICDTAATCGQVSCLLAMDWFNEINSVDDSIDWRILSGPTPSNTAFGTTGPSMDFNPGTSAGKYAYLEASGCYSKGANMISPCISLAGLQKASMTFAYHMRGSGMGELHLDVFADGAWTNDVHVLSGHQGDDWRTAAVSLTPFADKIITLRFRGMTGGNDESDMAIDDISIQPAALSAPAIAAAGLSLQVFPNPSSGVFNVAAYNVHSALDLSVTDAAGRVISKQQVLPSNGTAIATVQLGHVASGVYFLSVKNEEGVVQKKVVKL